MRSSHIYASCSGLSIAGWLSVMTRNASISIETGQRVISSKNSWLTITLPSTPRPGLGPLASHERSGRAATLKAVIDVTITFERRRDGRGDQEPSPAPGARLGPRRYLTAIHGKHAAHLPLLGRCSTHLARTGPQVKASQEMGSPLRLGGDSSVGKRDSEAGAAGSSAADPTHETPPLPTKRQSATRRC